VQPGTPTIVGDIRSGELRIPGKFDEVYHLAAASLLGPRTAMDEDRLARVNVEGTRNLLRALERTGYLPERLVFASSVAVYGARSGELLAENTPRLAADPYGASKRAAEDFVCEWGSRHRVHTGVVRLPLAVGRDARGMFGIMLRALKARRYLGVGRGSARRSMVLADDAVSGLRAVALKGGVFNLTDGRHPSFAEMETALAEVLGQPPPARIPVWAATVGALIGDAAEALFAIQMPLNKRVLEKMTTTLTFSDQKARNELGWLPFSVIESLREAVT
jgi:nucleoside-diphosphate-sugar epimerase